MRLRVAQKSALGELVARVNFWELMEEQFALLSAEEVIDIAVEAIFLLQVKLGAVEVDLPALQIVFEDA